MTTKSWIFYIIASILSVVMLASAILMCIPSTQQAIADKIATNLSPAYAEIKDDNENKDSQISDLTSEIDTLNKTITDKDASITAKNKQIAEKDSLISSQTEQLNTCNSNIQTLNTQKAGLLTAVTEIDNKINSTTDSVELDDLEIRKTAILAQIDTLNTQIATLTQEKTQLTQEIATLTQEKADLQAEVTQLESDKAELQAKVTSYDNTFADCEISLEPITFNDTPDFVYGSKVWTKHNGDIYYSDGATQYKFDKENKKWTSSGAYTNTTESPNSFVEDGSLNWYLNGRTYHSNGAEQVALGSYTKVNCTWTGVTEFSGKDVFVFNGKAYLKAGDATNGAYLYEYDGSSYTWKPVKFGQYCRYGYEVCIKKYCNLFEYNGDVYAIAYVKNNFSSSIQTIKINFDNYTWSTVNSCPNSILFDENVWSDGENYYYSNNGAHYKIVFAKKTEVETTKPSTKFQYYIDSSLIDLSTFTTDVELDVTFTSCPYGHGYASSEYKSCDKIFVGIDTDSETTKYVLKFHYADKDEYVTIGSNTDGTQTSFNVTLTFDNEPTGDILTFLQSYSTRMIYRV